MSVRDLEVFEQIDSWFGRAPSELDVEERIAWVQDNSEVACPRCGEILWIMLGENAANRGSYHLALCQSDDCDYQAAN